MIVRILGEGQYDVPATEVGSLEKLDTRLSAALDSGDAQGFSEALSELLEQVRSAGTVVDPTTIVTSELTIPHEGATLEEVKNLLASEETAE
jgi:hypothetical protein